MERKKIGQVTPEERDSIKLLFERRNGLNELARALANTNQEIFSSELYERLIKDMGENAVKFQGWWDEKSKKYNWENISGCNWEIDFQTCDIYLLNKGGE